MLPQFAYVRPSSLKEAVRHLSEAKSVLHAGGTDLMGCLRENILDAAKVVSIIGIEQLKGIHPGAGGDLSIGALTTISEVAQDPLIRQRYPVLAQGASQVASPQLRNQGTIGGNLCQKPRCWYYRGQFHCLRKGGDMCYAAEGQNQFHAIFGSGGICYIVHPSDTAPALVALNALVRIHGPKGRRTVPVEAFHVLPEDNVQAETVLQAGEIVTAIEIPAPSKGLRSSYRKVRARGAWDFALAGVALALQVDGDRVQAARVVLGGAAPVPWRCPAVEAVIKGRRLDEKTVTEAAQAAVEGAQALEKNSYKITLFRGLLQEQLTALVHG
jgi:xanthine dehydrogenase YagS FAD-binding subunit